MFVIDHQERLLKTQSQAKAAAAARQGQGQKCKVKSRKVLSAEVRTQSMSIRWQFP